MSDVKWTDIASIIVGITIPIVLHLEVTSLQEQQQADAEEQRKLTEKVELETRTLSRLRELDEMVTNAVGKKVELDFTNKISDEDKYSYSYINNPENYKVTQQVIIILNQYDELCLGSNLGLYSQNIINDLRIDAMKATFKDYGRFILKWREYPPAKDAWDNCEPLVGDMRT